MESGFVYRWHDKKHDRYYIGSHWGPENDGYICSSSWMKQAYKHRPYDFSRNILARIVTSHKDLLLEENKHLQTIDPQELGKKYYNLRNTCDWAWVGDKSRYKTIGENISAAKKGVPLTEAHKAALRGPRKFKHTNEWKAANAERLKQQWTDGTRKPQGPISQSHKDAISAANSGKKLSSETKDMIRMSQSKEYIIVWNSGKEEIVKGLKLFGVSNSIPYVTLRNALKKQTPIPKYDISRVLAA